MELAGLNFSDTGDHHGYRRRNGNDNPHERGEGEASKGADFEQQRAGRIEMANGAEGQKEDHGRAAGNEDERKVDGAMQALFLAAAKTFVKVLLVVGAHVRREAGEVISPAGKNVTDNLVNTDLPHSSFANPFCLRS